MAKDQFDVGQVGHGACSVRGNAAALTPWWWLCTSAQKGPGMKKILGAWWDKIKTISREQNLSQLPFFIHMEGIYPPRSLLL